MSQIKIELIKSINDLNSRGLLLSSKWSSEQLNGLSPTILATPLTNEEQLSILSQPSISSPPIGSNEYYKYILAKNYFDLKEYRRCSDVLIDCNKYQLPIFLRSYATYLAIEKRREEDIIEQQSQQQQQQQLQQAQQQAQQQQQESQQNESSKNNDNNKTDQQLQQQIKIEQCQEFKQLFQFYKKLYIENKKDMDGFLLYFYSILLKKQRDFTMARKVLIESVHKYPCNWSAWTDLSSLCSDSADIIMQLSLPDHFMKDFFLAHFKLELQQNNESLVIYQQLSRTLFTQSTYILAQTAIGNYNLRAYDIGEELFERLIELEPNRLENIDIYSNILYVRDKKAALSMLAHKAMKIEKYCPETCCIIGNYYSLKLEHDKAILYFQRALKLNDRYLSAWTLIGHEFLEIKNVSAAINAYRKAVDINPRDYRAWYGLGQTYQLLKLPLYSLYYFKKATTLRPYDPRMWCAAGGCYEFIERIPEAIKCYERAEENYDRERVAINKLAKLYQEIQNNEKAAFYYKKNLYYCDQEKIDGQEIIDALLFLANFYKNQNQPQSEQYCLRLLDYAGPEKEEAKSILREIHSKSKLSSKSKPIK
ncbi:hypothetical protein ACTA71_002700 [Dictyostelium dimigraforme]